MYRLIEDFIKSNPDFFVSKLPTMLESCQYLNHYTVNGSTDFESNKDYNIDRENQSYCSVMSYINA